MRAFYSAAYVVCIAVLFVIGIHLCGTVTYGQEHPSMAAREQLADALNDMLLNPGQPLDLNGAVIEILNSDSECDVLQEGDVSIVPLSPGFKLRRKVRSSSTFVVTEPHELVNDLNRWINAMWAMDLTGIDAFDALGWSCPNDSADQRYFTNTTTASGCIDAVKERSTELDMLARDYSIDGVTRNGASFLSFSNSTPRAARFIADRYSSPHPTRTLAGGYISIKIPGCDSLVLEWEATTQRYHGDCGIAEHLDKGTLIVKVNGQAVVNQFSGNNADADGGNAGFLSSLYNRSTEYWAASMDTLDATHIGGFNIDQSGYLTFSIYHGSYRTTYFNQTVCRLVTPVLAEEICEQTFPCGGGQFEVDPTTGKLFYIVGSTSGCDNGCEKQPVHCIPFCDYVNPQIPTLDNVIQASVATYADAWQFPAYLAADLDEDTKYGDVSEFEDGERGKWRPLRQYVYRSPVQGGTGMFGNSAERNYKDAGVFPFTQFDWADISLVDTTKWVRSSTVVQYSTHGEPMLEYDALGFPSGAIFDPRLRLPLMVANNAGYKSIRFYSFETYNGATTDFAHSGRKSFRILPGEKFSKNDLVVDTQMVERNALIQLWVKRTYNQDVDAIPIQIGLEYAGPVGSVSGLAPVAKTGEWTLYQGTVTGIVFGPNGEYGQVHIVVENILANDDIWIDDVRIQPFDAEAKCFVYDPVTMRLTTVFDEQHFGTYYQYNGEGKLVRTIRETERGFRTIAEQQYHTPLIARSSPILGKVGAKPDRAGDAFGYDGQISDPAGSGISIPDSVAGSILDVSLSKDGADLTWFGGANPDLSQVRLPAFAIPDIPSPDLLSSVGLPNLAEYELVRRFDSLDQSIRRIDSVSSNEDDDAASLLENGKEELKEQQRRILDELGRNEEEVRGIVERIREHVKPDEVNE